MAIPEPIAFGLKSDWWRMSYGYAVGKEYPGLVQTFALTLPLAVPVFNLILAARLMGIPNVIGGLGSTANKDGQKNNNIPRTFVGVRDDDNNGHSETVIFYSSAKATQAYAVKILNSFGAGSKMMLTVGEVRFDNQWEAKIVSSRQRYRRRLSSAAVDSNEAPYCCEPLQPNRKFGKHQCVPLSTGSALR